MENLSQNIGGYTDIFTVYVRIQLHGGAGTVPCFGVISSYRNNSSSLFADDATANRR